MKKVLISLLTFIVVFNGCQNQKDSFKSESNMISLEEGLIGPVSIQYATFSNNTGNRQ